MMAKMQGSVMSKTHSRCFHEVLSPNAQEIGHAGRGALAKTTALSLVHSAW
jgi:hypothetical protein